MSRRSRPHYHSGLEWILGVAFEDTLTRPARLAQGFTHVRCCGSPRASSPHGLAAPALASRDGRDCVQLPPARGCYHLAPRRTFTSNPVPMPGTPPERQRRRILILVVALPCPRRIHPAQGGQYWTRKGVAIGRDLTAKIKIHHPSDDLGAVLAATAHAGGSGKGFLTQLSVADRVEAALTAADAPFRAHGFNSTTQLTYSLGAGGPAQSARHPIR